MAASINEELIKRIERDLIDGYDEELELEIEDRNPEGLDVDLGASNTDEQKETANVA